LGEAFINKTYVNFHASKEFMRRFQNLCLLFVFSFTLFFICFSSLGFAETLYVKSSKTKLRSSDNVKASVLGLLVKGTAVTVIVKSKRFFKVGLENGQKGWVFKFKLSKKAPAGGGSGGGGFADVLAGNQISANESTSASSIRGLSPVSENYAKNKGISTQNVQAVDNMEAFKVDSVELDKFLQEGKLGEYGP
jgi:uncharacterized protein YgiM (DUF1202 family)